MLALAANVATPKRRDTRFLTSRRRHMSSRRVVSRHRRQCLLKKRRDTAKKRRRDGRFGDTEDANDRSRNDAYFSYFEVQF